MNRPAFLSLLFCTTIICGCSTSHSTDNAPQIQISQLLGNRPLGLLGKPIGKRTTIEGKFNNHVLLANPLEIIKVDDRPLPQPINLELQGIDTLKPDITYKLEGYESGAFVGEPDWENPEVQQPFQFRPSFVVTRILAPVPSDPIKR